MDLTEEEKKNKRQRTIIHKMFTGLDNNNVGMFWQQARELGRLRGESTHSVVFAFIQILNNENWQLFKSGYRVPELVPEAEKDNESNS